MTGSGGIILDSYSNPTHKCTLCIWCLQHSSYRVGSLIVLLVCVSWGWKVPPQDHHRTRNAHWDTIGVHRSRSVSGHKCSGTKIFNFDILKNGNRISHRNENTCHETNEGPLVSTWWPWPVHCLKGTKCFYTLHVWWKNVKICYVYKYFTCHVGMKNHAIIPLVPEKKFLLCGWH